MPKIVIEIPDGYDRLEGVVEVYCSDSLSFKLPYQNVLLDRDLVFGEDVLLSFDLKEK